VEHGRMKRGGDSRNGQSDGHQRNEWIGSCDILAETSGEVTHLLTPGCGGDKEMVNRRLHKGHLWQCGEV
jgi:hypothetical protein